MLEVLRPPGGAEALSLARSWRDPVEDARRRAGRGHLEPGQRLLLVTKTTIAAFYRAAAARDRPDERLSWAARIPDGGPAGLVVALDECLDEDAAERLFAELSEAGIDCTVLRLGRMAGYPELKRFAVESLPGAFGAE